MFALDFSAFVPWLTFHFRMLVYRTVTWTSLPVNSHFLPLADMWTIGLTLSMLSGARLLSKFTSIYLLTYLTQLLWTYILSSNSWLKWLSTPIAYPFISVGLKSDLSLLSLYCLQWQFFLWSHKISTYIHSSSTDCYVWVMNMLCVQYIVRIWNVKIIDLYDFLSYCILWVRYLDIPYYLLF